MVRGVADYRELRDRGEVLHEAISRSQVTLLAGAIAFFGLLSIVPLAVVVVALAATLGGGDIIDPILSAFDHLITAEAADIVRTGLEADAGRSGATVAGLVFALWASLRVFRGLDRAFNTIYGVPGASNILESALNGLAVLLALLGIAAIVGVVLVGLNFVGIGLPMASIPVLTPPLLAIVLLPMYAVFPPGAVAIRPAIPGAIVAGVAITAATAGLQLYIELIGPFAVYGVLAGIFIAMLWFYVIAIAILLGAVVNATELGKHRQLHVDGTS